MMLATERLILEKAKESDWAAMLKNVWSRPECARYMLWNVTKTPEEARARMRRTIAFQKEHDTYLVYLRQTCEAIGFAGVEETEPGTCQEMGICLGSSYWGQGLGKEILGCLMDYSRAAYGAERFLYSAREENAASNALARSMGFTPAGSEVRMDPRDGREYRMLLYRIILEKKA